MREDWVEPGMSGVSDWPAWGIIYGGGCLPMKDDLNMDTELRSTDGAQFFGRVVEGGWGFRAECWAAMGNNGEVEAEVRRPAGS